MCDYKWTARASQWKVKRYGSSDHNYIPVKKAELRVEVREDEVMPFNGSIKGVQPFGSILPAVKMPLMYLM